MGWETVEVAKVVASVSRHNSDKDESDDALVEELKERIEDIVREPRYRQITAMML